MKEVSAIIKIYVSSLGDFPQEGKGWRFISQNDKFNPGPAVMQSVVSIDATSFEQRRAMKALVGCLSSGLPLESLVKCREGQAILSKIVGAVRVQASGCSEFVPKDKILVQIVHDPNASHVLVAYPQQLESLLLDLTKYKLAHLAIRE